MSRRFVRTTGLRWIAAGALALWGGSAARAQQAAPDAPSKPDATPAPTAPASTAPAQPSTPAPAGAPSNTEPDRPGQLPGESQAVTPSHPASNSWQYIVIHHSASPSGNASIFDRMHRAKGWDGVAYHFVITNGHGGPDGGLQVSPRWWVQKHGAHAGALPGIVAPDDRNCYNEFGIGICLVGNFEHQAPTHRQLETLAKLIGKLQAKYHIPADQILGHGHVKSTACPGSHFPWQTVFAMAHLPTPQHLYRHYAAATLDRCPWCRAKGYVPSARIAHHTPAKPGEASIHDLAVPAADPAASVNPTPAATVPTPADSTTHSTP